MAMHCDACGAAGSAPFDTPCDCGCRTWRGTVVATAPFDTPALDLSSIVKGDPVAGQWLPSSWPPSTHSAGRR